MTIRHLKIFVTVAECGTMHQAANILFVSQPSISQAIAELENYYGVKVFERMKRKIYLTPEGKQLLPKARHLIESFDNLDLSMKNAGYLPMLRIGASVSVGVCLMNDILDKLESNLKELETQVIVNNTSVIETMLCNSELDVGLVEGDVEDQNLRQVKVYDDELVIVVGKGHPMYGRERVSLFDLDGMSLISREEGSVKRNQYEHLLVEKGIKLKTKWISTNTEAIKNAVIHGKGLAIMSQLLVEKEVKEGKLFIVSVSDIKVDRDIRLIYHKDKFLSRPLMEFIEICSNYQKLGS